MMTLIMFSSVDNIFNRTCFTIRPPIVGWTGVVFMLTSQPASTSAIYDCLQDLRWVLLGVAAPTAVAALHLPVNIYNCLFLFSLRIFVERSCALFYTNIRKIYIQELFVFCLFGFLQKKTNMILLSYKQFSVWFNTYMSLPYKHSYIFLLSYGWILVK